MYIEYLLSSKARSFVRWTNGEQLLRGHAEGKLSTIQNLGVVNTDYQLLTCIQSFHCRGREEGVSGFTTPGFSLVVALVTLTELSVIMLLHPSCHAIQRIGSFAYLSDKGFVRNSLH